jgi:hypothetical protein
MSEAEELKHLRSENERMRDLLDRRPALNAGLVEAYVRWTELCYVSDMAAKPHDAEVH